jgi:hypothetical protein
MTKYFTITKLTELLKSKYNFEKYVVCLDNNLSKKNKFNQVTTSICGIILCKNDTKTVLKYEELLKIIGENISYIRLSLGVNKFINSDKNSTYYLLEVLCDKKLFKNKKTNINYYPAKMINVKACIFDNMNVNRKEYIKVNIVDERLNDDTEYNFDDMKF